MKPGSLSSTGAKIALFVVVLSLFFTLCPNLIFLFILRIPVGIPCYFGLLCYNA